MPKLKSGSTFYSEYSCECCVKVLCGSTHRRCHKTTTNSFLAGTQINLFLKSIGTNLVDEDKTYRVCHNLKNLIQHLKPNPPSRRRSNRLNIRPFERESNAIDKYNLIRLVWDDELQLDEVVFNRHAKSRAGPRVGHRTTFPSGVLQSSSKYRKAFKYKCPLERTRLVDMLTKELLACCVDSPKLKKEGMEYLEYNKQLAGEALTLLECVRLRVQTELLVNLSSLDNSTSFDPNKEGTNDIINDAADDDTRSEYSLDKPTQLRFAMSLLGHTTQNGYNLLRKDIINGFPIKPEILPSFYMMTKNRPKILPLCFGVSELHNTTISNGMIEANELVRGIDTVTMNMMDRYQLQTLESLNVQKALKQIKKESDGISGAKLEGEYKDHLKLMTDKHTRHGRNLCGSIVVLDSYNGANHYSNNTGDTSILSYSSQVYSSSMKNEISTSNSFNILTWQQVVAEEKIESIFPVIEEVYKQKQLLRKSRKQILSGCEFSFYEMHDGKMLYLLTQHSMWNRLNRPFLLCSCHRGDGVSNNESHKCEVINHDEQIRYYDRSNLKWNRKMKKPPSKGKKYGLEQHRDWVDEENLGVSHFGLHPDIFPRDSIRFDVFHLCVAIAKRLMNYLRKIVMKLSIDFQTKFFNELSKFWSPYHILIWKCNKTFSNFKGDEIKKFVVNCPILASLLRKSLQDTEEVTASCKALDLWFHIEKFMKISEIDDAAAGEQERKIQEFTNRITEFYTCGKITFLTKKKTGDDETFYMHALRYYIPKIALDTWRDHGAGIGIFTMQGFERRNKESKNTLRRFNNNKGNVVVQNLKRLWDLYFYEHVNM